MNRREAFATTGMGLASGVSLGTLLLAASCQPTAVPAAEPDPMLELATAYIAAIDAANQGGIDDDEDIDAYCAVHIDPLRDRITEGAPTPTTMVGLIATLRLAERVMGQEDLELAEPLVQAAVRFFDGRAV